MTASAETLTSDGQHLRPSGAMATVLLAYAFAVIMAGTTLPTPMYALYATTMGFTVLTTTMIYAAYAGGVLAALVVFGRWSDAVGRRPVLLAGVALAIASAATFLIADTVPALVVARVLSGLSAGIFTGTATAAIIESAPPKWRNRAAATATIANIGGLGAGPLLAGVLVQYCPAPLHLAFVIHIVLAVAAGLAVVAVPETTTKTGQLGIQRLRLPVQVRGTFALAAIGMFAGFACMGLFTALAPSFLSTMIGTDNHAGAGLVASCTFLASAIAQIAANRIQPQRAMALGCAMLVIGMIALAAALVTSSLAGLVVAAIISGAGQGISFSRGLAAITEATPADQRAEVSSALFVVAYIAISLPVIGEGLVAERWGLRSAGIGFAGTVGILAAGCLIALLARQPRRQPGRARSWC
ncbi:MFS transporter [Mycolicibacterium boenickei]|uniref:MFS transporter n=1 Tax=Mycolicibacterium boenickei TaxID=146017 RepID=A0AAX3A340_9MYCO|nr:MFS transporter [Mycolicibacterium boenickei]UNC02133.1 MFS transporter [Mycolicibacterium boenickei]BBX92095.1 MFS transporter [Mycolicibacterium boenickei]